MTSPPQKQSDVTMNKTTRSIISVKLGLTALIAVAAFAASANAAVITHLADAGYLNGTTSAGTYTLSSFDAGSTADALMVEISAQTNATAGQVSVTYDGHSFTPVYDHLGTTASIWYLHMSGDTQEWHVVKADFVNFRHHPFKS